MPTFKDSTGQEWHVAIDVDGIRRCRKQLEVDLMEALGGKLVVQFSADPVLLVDVLYLLCQPECQERNLSDEQFGRLLADGDAIDGAIDAFTEALINFSRPHQRPALARVWEQLKETNAKQGQMVLAKADKIGELAERELAKASAELDKVFEEAFADPPPASSGD